MISIRHNETLPRDFRSLQARSGNRVSSKLSAVGAIKNSIFTVGIYLDEELVAFGRVCGDYHLYFLICDIMLDKRLTNERYINLVVKELDDFLRLAATKDSQVIVEVDKPMDELFAKIGFKYFDEDYRLVMRRK